jgi:hypothetical protein
MDKKTTIFILTVFIFISLIYLSYIGEKQLDPNWHKNWWVLSFENPKDNSLNFVIENHSDKNNFHWQVSSDDDKILEGDEKIQKGEVQKIAPEKSTEDLCSDGKRKVTIAVTSGITKREIYKYCQK